MSVFQYVGGNKCSKLSISICLFVCAYELMWFKESIPNLIIGSTK